MQSSSKLLVLLMLLLLLLLLLLLTKITAIVGWHHLVRKAKQGNPERKEGTISKLG
jgi:hypothetical protein